jgi:crossover junction endodeoxyribonuclease RuvC
MTRFVGIDPATQTGFVALDKNGSPVVEIAFRGKGIKVPGGISPKQRVSLQNQLYSLLKPGDIILKEGIANGNMMLITTSKIHGGLEDMITRKELKYDEVAPLSVKKFVNVNMRNIDKGLKGIEKEKAKKAEMAAAALKHFGYENPSHDIVDAYIIAKICESVYRVRNGEKTLDDYYLEYQREVIWSIIDPDGYKEYEKTKKKKSKSTKRREKPAAADSHTQMTEQQFLF